jgi:acyl-CoA synthetase (AMP-forming)/AMP-acid ligase II
MDVLDRARTVTGALAELAELAPGFPCLTILDRRRGEQRLTFGQIWAGSLRIRSVLVDRGLRRGEIVLIVLPTGPELVAAYFGTMLAGGIPGVLAGPAHRLAEPGAYAAHVGRILSNAGARIVYAEDGVAGLFRARRELLPPEVLVVAEGEAEDAQRDDRIVPDPEEIATIQYSSGSTGAPKGVLLSHRAILNNLRDLRSAFALGPGDVSVNWIPLYHDMGLIDGFLLPLLAGCPTVLIPTLDFLREPVSWLRALHARRGSVSFAPNFAYALCAHRIPEADLEGLDLSNWRVAANGAEPVLAPTLAAFAERFERWGFRPQAMTPIWGMAETVTAATAHPVEEPPRVETVDRNRLAREDFAWPTAGGGLEVVSVGRCLPNAAVEIRDETGRVLPERHAGTIWLRTTYLASGYHRDPELTRRVFVDGWLDTGDRGYLADGRLYFLAREKDLIVIAGAKYAPNDIEEAINGVPGVREGCAVAFGVLDETIGTEELAAVVETRQTDPEEMARLRQRIAAEVRRRTGLTLRHLLLVPPGGVEKTTSGKLARRATRSRYLEVLRFDSSRRGEGRGGEPLPG